MSAERGWSALRLTARTFLDTDLWLVATPVAVAAGLAALLVGARRVGTYLLAFAVVSLLACWLVIWTIPSLELTQDYGLNPIVRLVGTPVLVLAVITPVALQRAWHTGAAPARSRPQSRRTRIVAWSIVGAMVALYPLSAITGTSAFRLPGGWPEFPKAEGGTRVPSGRQRRWWAYEGRREKRRIGSCDEDQDARCLRLRRGLANLGLRPAETDDALVGWSEVTDSHGSPRGRRGVVEDLAPLVVGKDPRAFEAIHWDLYRRTRQSPGSIVQKAIGGIENALLDLAGKAHGVSVAELLGGPTRATHPAVLVALRHHARAGLGGDGHHQARALRGGCRTRPRGRGAGLPRVQDEHRRPG